MRRRTAFAIAMTVGILILSTAVPANAAVRLRQYKGQTSQAHIISFFVAKTDAGRLIREMWFNLDYTCEDQTTQRSGWGFGLGNTVPITDGAFSFDEVDQGLALHVAGDLGRLQGQGTLTLSFPAFTPDEQVQLCTTGDLTWEVEFRRVIPVARSMLLQATSYARPTVRPVNLEQVERRLHEGQDALGRRADSAHL